ncbi:MAG: hypothetical protein H0A75_08210 [Candidatus Methanofishera endochildressiae]|uniref:Uncharacterized protein n=1 Tax=Candidatus Methanofishera endochildressiae TaxID=2738884 RepID=A0A7Z0MPJ9_9GAMM|nr:hypothetical protein [Candidatus Methanofishera endochildressiae]
MLVLGFPEYLPQAATPGCCTECYELQSNAHISPMVKILRLVDLPEHIVIYRVINPTINSIRTAVQSNTSTRG